jgi:hypothetical protein
MPRLFRRSNSQQVGNAAEAYLSGTCARYLQGQHKQVPTWAWINALAHCSPQGMRNIAVGLDHGLPRGFKLRRWKKVIHLLAAEMVKLAEIGEHSIEDLQRQALVPLEDRLLQGIEPHDPSTPENLASCTFTTLSSAFPSGHRAPRGN